MTTSTLYFPQVAKLTKKQQADSIKLRNEAHQVSEYTPVC